eukprot:TRINITY_DN10312_c0_g1_i1.p1 TRINITY_DN10312_c0_g1~~TRINITY_DN10312_c0_g1_i1.p1  ORF type:complete len:218 (+),score=20.39 TRINITY_DN10312_c0_g1_i1:78-731(+)
MAPVASHLISSKQTQPLTTKERSQLLRVAKVSISYHEMSYIYNLAGYVEPPKHLTSVPMLIGRVSSEVPYEQADALACGNLALRKDKLGVKASSPKKGLKTMLRVEILYIPHGNPSSGIGRKKRGCFVDYETMSRSALETVYCVQRPVVVCLPMTRRLAAMSFKDDVIALCMTALSRDGHNSAEFIKAFNEAYVPPCEETKKSSISVASVNKLCKQA